MHVLSVPRASFPLLVTACAGLLALGGCRTRLLEQNIVVETYSQLSCQSTEAPTPKIDVLVMVDNSGSMDAMQDQLRTRFPQFLGVLHALAQKGVYVDLHLGVVTSDYGAGKTGTGGQCSPSPGGQKGKLQAVGQLADPSCLPPTGANFVQYVFSDQGDGPNNLPMGQTLDQTFTCMASVGANGCGYEHQLESVYAALHDSIPENAGFLRDDAFLVVLFLTNEDDCSAPPDTDLFDGNIRRYGQTFSFRCTRYGIECGTPPDFAPYYQSGVLSGCMSAPNPNDQGPGRLFDLNRYLDLFTRPMSEGGIKVDPNDVLLAAIDAPESPFQVVLADPLSGLHTGMPYTLCPMLDENPMSGDPCVPVLQHSCQAAAPNGGFFGDPAVRINALVNAATNHAIGSICQTDYTSTLQSLGQLVVSKTGQCCLPDKLPADPRDPTNDSSFVADCTVEQVTQPDSGPPVTVAVPECAPGVAYPCWSVVKKAQCQGIGPQSLGVTVNYGGQPVPPHTTTHAKCLTSLTGTPS